MTRSAGPAPRSLQRKSPGGLATRSSSLRPMSMLRSSAGRILPDRQRNSRRPRRPLPSFRRGERGSRPTILHLQLRSKHEAMRGRKPKPTYLKLLNGNPGKRALNEQEPKPERALPTRVRYEPIEPPSLDLVGRPFATNHSTPRSNFADAEVLRGVTEAPRGSATVIQIVH